MIGNIEYGTWKDGSSIYKDNKGYYIIQWDNNKKEEYKKYIKNWKSKYNNEKLYLDKINKKWNTKTKHKTIHKTKKNKTKTYKSTTNNYKL
jgi:hypothetical protein